MSTKTVIPFGSDQSVVKYSAGLFAANQQRNSVLNRLKGPMPKQSDAENKIKQVSSPDYPIVQVRDFEKSAGDEVIIDLVNPIGGIPAMGDEFIEGKGVGMTFSSDRLRINATRKPIDVGSVMTQQRTVYDLAKLARAQAVGYLGKLEDQRILTHLAGARGFHNTAEWVLPLASHAKFAEIMVNTVRAPSKNRHYMASGGVISSFAAAGDEVTIQTTDTMSTDVVDSLATFLDSMTYAPGPVKFEGDMQAEDSPLRVLLVSPEQYNGFLRSGLFRTWQSNAMARANQANKHPLMMGDAGVWRNILIVKMPKPIRFYAGDAINHCASATSRTETATDLVPAAFGTGFAVDRALLLGGQALANAVGVFKTPNGVTNNMLSLPGVHYHEALLDHASRMEIAVSTMGGYSKVQFLQEMGNGVSEYTDHGVIAIDTAVSLVN